MRKNSTAYAVGDIAYMTTLPSWARLECVKDGTTAATEPSVSSITSAGVLLTDGTCKWIVDDVRDGSRVGDIIIRPTLRDGFVKANGATLKASEYPRLLRYAQDNGLTVTAAVYATDCSKYVYDSTADTLIVPNMIGRVLQGGDTVKSVNAGLPNIIGEFSFSDSWCPPNPVGSGSFVVQGSGSAYMTRTGIDVNEANGFSFDASKSNAIYGRADTVQPSAIYLIPQIKY